jgi:hypothetical protein
MVQTDELSIEYLCNSIDVIWGILQINLGLSEHNLLCTGAGSFDCLGWGKLPNLEQNWEILYVEGMLASDGVFHETVLSSIIQVKWVC